MSHPIKASRSFAFRLGAASAVALTFSTMPAFGQEDEDAESANDVSVLPRILVTAQKRVEDSNSVPMSINVATADQLDDAGITQPKDLVKLSPSFNYSDSILGTPIYTLRGVGFADISLGGRPTVSVYVDEAPIPFAIETRGAHIDLERVEVLKGPQGTLFGQNATGGAINYIAAKPTDEFEAGLNVGLGRFSALELGGFVSGPLSDTLSARLAVETSEMDDWQESYTTGATNGSVDFANARFSLAWEPSSSFSSLLTVGGFKDKSDTTAGQAIEIRPNIAAAAAFLPQLTSYPLAPESPTAADFNPEENYARDNEFAYANLRFDYEFAGGVTLTSLTSLSEYDEDRLVDTDGTALANLDVATVGSIESFSQELRLSSTFGDRGNWVVGLNYAQDEVLETEVLRNPESTVAFTFIPFGRPLFTSTRDINNQESTTTAIFANVDYDITDQVNLYGGVRYTDAEIDHEGCSADVGDGNAAGSFTLLWSTFRDGVGLPPITPIEPGGCTTADATFTPILVQDELNEDNVSWRAGLDWTPSSNLLLYANVSEGYKAGSFPTLAASLATQLEPATQESLLAYEAGFKSTLLNDTMQLNGAVFQYDYTDKQVLGQVADPVFGTLLRLINIPESEIFGLELDALWVPVDGLTLKGGVSHIDSEIGDGFTGFGPFGDPADFSGQPFPQTPDWHFVGDANYEWNVSEDLVGFVGAGVTYQSATNNSLGEVPVLEINERTLVDLRAGFGSSDGRWRISAWGRNVGDEYYWTAAQPNLDTTVRYAGMPATYGIEFDIRFD